MTAIKINPSGAQQRDRCAMVKRHQVNRMMRTALIVTARWPRGGFPIRQLCSEACGQILSLLNLSGGGRAIGWSVPYGPCTTTPSIIPAPPSPSCLSPSYPLALVVLPPSPSLLPPTSQYLRYPSSLSTCFCISFSVALF